MALCHAPGRAPALLRRRFPPPSGHQPELRKRFDVESIGLLAAIEGADSPLSKALSGETAVVTLKVTRAVFDLVADDVRGRERGAAGGN